MSHINKNNASHLSKLLFQSIHIRSVYLKYLEPWNFKYQNPELAHEYNSQMFNKMSRKKHFLK